MILLNCMACIHRAESSGFKQVVRKLLPETDTIFKKKKEKEKESELKFCILDSIRRLECMDGCARQRPQLFPRLTCPKAFARSQPHLRGSLTTGQPGNAAHFC